MTASEYRFHRQATLHRFGLDGVPPTAVDGSRSHDSLRSAIVVKMTLNRERMPCCWFQRPIKTADAARLGAKRMIELRKLVWLHAS